MSVLFPKTITVVRKTGSYNSNGEWTLSADSTLSIIGDVQPISGRELEFLNVGRQDVGKIKMYSNTQLKVSVEGSTNPGDMVTWQGKNWEIIAETAHQNSLIPHYKYIAEFRG